MNLNPFAISGLTLVLTCSFLTLLILIYGKTKLHRLWAFFNIAVGIWGLGAFLIGVTTGESRALIYWRFANIGIIFISVFFFHMICTFCEISRRPIIIFAYLQGFFFLILDATNLFISRMKFVFNSFYYIQSTGPFYPAFVIIWLSLVLWGHIELYKFLRTAQGVKRSQALYLFFGMFTGFLGGTTNFFPPFGLNLYPWGNFSISLYCCIVTYAVLKYRLMDIRVVVTRTIIFIITYGPILSIPIILSTIFKPGLVYLIGDRWWLVPVLVYTIAITLAPFLYQKLQRKVEGEILFKDERRNHAMILTAARSIALVRNFDRLLNLIVRILTKTLGIKYASVYLLDRDAKQYKFCVTRGGKKIDIAIDLGNSLIKYLQGARKAIIYEELKREYDERRDIFIKEIRDTMNRIGADLLVPSFIENELIGFLALGPKKSGETYTNEDINVLSNMANQSALAIENTQFLKEREEMQGKLREAETLTTIRDLLGSFNHELYNLLTPVSITLQKIAMGDYDKMVEKLKPDAQKNVETTFFIKTYLGWVREYVESGTKIAAYPLSELINSGVSYSKDRIEKQNIKIDINVNPKIFVVGYESLPLLFKHLIIHSIYGYGMENSGSININVRILEDGSTVEITQTDTGHDLCEYLKDGSTMGGTKFAEKGKLGGVSYFIAQAVVSQHKGIFELEPTGGKGTKFKILLPLDFNKVTA